MQERVSRTEAEKEQFWKDAIERHRASGLTQREFCRTEGLHAPTMSTWKALIQEKEADAVFARAQAARKRHWKKRQAKLPAAPEQEARESYWRKVVAQFNHSGLSKDEFCAKKDIKPGALCWWRGELCRRDSKKRQAVAVPLQNVQTFLPLTVAEPPQSDPIVARDRTIVAEIDISRGVVRIFEGAGAAILTNLLKVIKELCK